MRDLLEAPDWVSKAITRFLFDLAKIYMVLMGLLILGGGQARMNAPAYITLTHWAPWWAWGGSLLLLGVWSVVPFVAVRLWCYTCAAVWFWVWEAALVVNAFDEAAVMVHLAPDVPRPGWTGMAAYFFSATLFTALAVAMWLDRSGKGGGWLSHTWGRR